VPQIAQGLKKITCAQGKAARFEAVIHGQPAPQITWCDQPFDVFFFSEHT